MSKYKVKVKVEIVETDVQTETDVEEQEDGSFELIMSEAEAISIDDCEQAVLRTHYPAIREALSKHLADMSKKKQQKPGNSEEK